MQGQLQDAVDEVSTLQATMAELRKDVDAAEKEAKHSRRMLRIAMAQSQIKSTPSLEQQLHATIPDAAAGAAPATAATTTATTTATVTATATETSPREIPVDPEAAERLKRLEDGIKELLQWKQGASGSLQLSTAQAPRWNGSEAAEDVSPRRAPAAAATAMESAPQYPAESPYQPPPPPMQTERVPLQRQPSNNLAAAATNPLASSFPTTLPPLTTTLHTRSASNTPPRSPIAPTSPHKQPSHSQNAPSSPALRRQFLRELPHEAVGHERPGVISRFPHPLSDLRAVRQELQAELESELVSELASQGIHDPEGCRGLTPAEYLSCMEALQQRRAAAASQMNEQDKAREQYMRKTVTMHVDSATKSVIAATKTTTTPATSQSPPPLPLPPQTRPALRPTTLRVRTTATPPAAQPTTMSTNTSMEPSPVDLAMLEVRDQETDAFYSPLRRGHSVNDGVLPGTPGTPSRQQQQPFTTATATAV